MLLASAFMDQAGWKSSMVTAWTAWVWLQQHLDACGALRLGIATKVLAKNMPKH